MIHRGFEDSYGPRTTSRETVSYHDTYEGALEAASEQEGDEFMYLQVGCPQSFIEKQSVLYAAQEKQNRILDESVPF